MPAVSTNCIGKQTRFSLIKTDRLDNYSLEVLYLSKREHELVRAFVTTLLRSDPAEPMPKVEKRRHCRDLNVGSPEVDNEGHPLIPGCTPYSMIRWSPDDLTATEYEIPLAEQEFLFMRRVLTLLHGSAYLAGKEESDHAC